MQTRQHKEKVACVDKVAKRRNRTAYMNKMTEDLGCCYILLKSRNVFVLQLLGHFGRETLPYGNAFTQIFNCLIEHIIQ